MAMCKTLNEWTAIEGAGGQPVEAGDGVIRGVKILGFSSRNGRTYAASAVKRAAAMYEGVSVNVDHATDAKNPRSYKDRFGNFRNVKFVEGQGLYGDLHYNPNHPVAQQFEWDCKNAPNRCGFSHTADGKWTGPKGAHVVEEILSVKSVDLVADPATTAGVFEHTEPEENSMSLENVTLRELRESRPELIKEIEKYMLESIEKESDGKADAEELARLREAVAKLEGEKKANEEAAQFSKALSEHKLPALDSEEAKGVYGESLLESLKQANVSARLAMVDAFAAGRGEVNETEEVRVTSKDQNTVTEAVADTKSFVASILK